MRINPKQIEKIAKQMGMQMETIDATEVIIKTKEKDLVIKNPQVSKMVVQGMQTFQISGEVIEVMEEEKVNKEDIDLIVQKTGVSEEEAKKLLEETGDIALAIKKARE